MNVGSLISLLSDGQFHSGSDLGVHLGVSRAAIWKALGRLEEYGLEVESIKGKGYRLVEPLSLLDRNFILESLSQEVSEQVSLDVLLSVDSTNQYLMNEGQSESSPFRFVVAERQTAGRGRRGRSWVSPFGKNIYMSVGFELKGGVDVLSGLSLVVGIAVVRAIRSCSEVDAKLKWPNDVWVGGKKAAGILVELQGEATTGWRVVVGLGINVAMNDEDARDIDQPWIALGEALTCTKNEFAKVLIESLVEVLSVFSRQGLKVFMSEWQSMDLLFDVNVVVGGANIVGVAKGVDESGALKVSTDKGLELVNAGEVSVRPNEA